MREKIADFKIEDLTGETEKKLIRQEVLKEIAEEVRAIKNPKPLVPEDSNEWYHGFENFRQKVLDILEEQ